MLLSGLKKGDSCLLYSSFQAVLPAMLKMRNCRWILASVNLQWQSLLLDAVLTTDE